jgi:hypothetical protein
LENLTLMTFLFLLVSVTESSVGGICNKSAGGFSSGLKNATATFSELFNDTSTKFAYCTVPTHCQKGMFTIMSVLSVHHVPKITVA